jgi:hypothetical protein
LHFYLAVALFFFAGLKVRPVFDHLVQGHWSQVSVSNVLSTVALVFLSLYLVTRRGTRIAPGTAK